MNSQGKHQIIGYFEEEPSTAEYQSLCGDPIQQFLSHDFKQFQVLLTLFPKFFSPFPYGTCALSDYHRYLALDGIYHLS